MNRAEIISKEIREEKEKCKCGGYICSYINFNDMGECCDCHKPYIFKDGKWVKTSKSEFRVEYRKRLIEQQESNWRDKE